MRALAQITYGVAPPRMQIEIPEHRLGPLEDLALAYPCSCRWTAPNRGVAYFLVIELS